MGCHRSNLCKLAHRPRSPSHVGNASSGWSDTHSQEAPVTTRLPMPYPAVFVQEIVVACAEYDPARVRDELDLAAEALAIGGCIDEVLFPAMRQIGDLWHCGHLDLDAERLTSEVVRGWLEVLTLRAPEPIDAATLAPRVRPRRPALHRARGAWCPAAPATATLPRPRQQDVGPGPHDGRAGEPTQRRRDRVPPEGQPRERHPVTAGGCCTGTRGVLRRGRLRLRSTATTRPRNSSGHDRAGRLRPHPRAAVSGDPRLISPRDRLALSNAPPSCDGEDQGCPR